MDQSEMYETSEPAKTGFTNDNSIIVYPIDKYNIEVKLSPDGRFLGITGISFNKNFLSFKRKENLPPLFDLDAAYPEEDSD